MSRVLIVEDEEAIADLEKDYLELSGFTVEIENNGTAGLKRALSEEFDMFILDLMLPGTDGFEICKKIREEKNTPILMVSAKKDDIDKIRGLGLGADDYITKPFGSMELLARVHANLRRYEQILRLKNAAAASQKETEEAHTLTAGGLELDLYTKQLTVDGKNVKLTPKEYAILELLMRSPGRVYSAEQIYENVWQESANYTVENTVMVHIRHIREKIEIDAKKPRYVKVVWGIGYKMEQHN